MLVMKYYNAGNLRQCLVAKKIQAAETAKDVSPLHLALGAIRGLAFLSSTMVCFVLILSRFIFVSIIIIGTLIGFPIYSCDPMTFSLKFIINLVSVSPSEDGLSLRRDLKIK